jgi:uncharacterized protein YndB with AHSA1/START domain
MGLSNQGVGAAASTDGREIVATRVFDAPRELVFAMWTDPKHVGKWWGPRGFTTTIQEMDVRPGGTWRLVMHGPDGRDYKNRIVYLEVLKPERLVYKHEPEEGSEPVSILVTVTFAAEGAKTRMHMQMLFPSAEELHRVEQKYGAIEGLQQTLSRLEEELGKAPIVVEQSLVASVEAVWRAITEKDQMKQWFFETIDSFRPEVGFQTRFKVRSGDKDYVHLWKVAEVVPRERIAYDWRYEGYPGDSRVTFELSPVDHVTKLKLIHEGQENFRGEDPNFSRENCTAGWKAFLGTRLTLYLQKAQAAANRELVLTRVFDAPRELVFRTWTEPKQVAEWWGPKGCTNPRCELDVRPGGAIRIDMRGPDGTVYPMTGVYKEIVEPERIVFTAWAVGPDGRNLFEVLTTVTLTEQSGRTTLRMEARVVESRPEAAPSIAGMRPGWEQSLDRLAEYLLTGRVRK